MNNLVVNELSEKVTPIIINAVTIILLTLIIKNPPLLNLLNLFLLPWKRIKDKVFIT